MAELTPCARGGPYPSPILECGPLALWTRTSPASLKTNGRGFPHEKGAFRGVDDRRAGRRRRDRSAACGRDRSPGTDGRAAGLKERGKPLQLFHLLSCMVLFPNKKGRCQTVGCTCLASPVRKGGAYERRRTPRALARRPSAASAKRSTCADVPLPVEASFWLLAAFRCVVSPLGVVDVAFFSHCATKV